MICTLEPSPSTLDTISKIANIVIAGFSLMFTVYIFHHQRKNNNIKNADSRRRDAFQTIILSHNLGCLFTYYNSVQTKANILSCQDLTDIDKENLNGDLQDELKNVRLKFIDLLLAVDVDLYNNVKDELDVLLDSLTESMFDAGINLQHPPMFEEKISGVILRNKTNVVRLLYDYIGQ